MNKTTTFLITLKTPIKVQQHRLDRSAIILKIATLRVEWPLSDAIDPKCVRNECGHENMGVCRTRFMPVETPLVDVTVTGFVSDETSQRETFWQSPLRGEGSEPFTLQLKRDNILSRQPVCTPETKS